MVTKDKEGRKIGNDTKVCPCPERADGDHQSCRNPPVLFLLYRFFRNRLDRLSYRFRCGVFVAESPAVPIHPRCSDNSRNYQPGNRGKSADCDKDTCKHRTDRVPDTSARRKDRVVEPAFCRRTQAVHDVHCRRVEQRMTDCRPCRKEQQQQIVS